MRNIIQTQMSVNNPKSVTTPCRLLIFGNGLFWSESVQITPGKGALIRGKMLPKLFPFFD